jgi:hypothetical protein
MVTGAADSVIKVWQTPLVQLLLEIKEHMAPIVEIALLLDTIISADLTGIIIHSDLTTGKMLKRTNGPAQATHQLQDDCIISAHVSEDRDIYLQRISDKNLTVKIKAGTESYSPAFDATLFPTAVRLQAKHSQFEGGR